MGGPMAAEDGCVQCTGGGAQGKREETVREGSTAWFTQTSKPGTTVPWACAENWRKWQKT